MLSPSLREKFKSDLDFALANLAVQRGLLSHEQVQECLGRAPFAEALVQKGYVMPEQLAELRATARPIPKEVLAAAENTDNQIGKYVRVRILGHGGMGDVYLAWDTELGRSVALKFMKDAGDPTARERFMREARLASALNHPNIASVYEVGNHVGTPFLAMQYIQGSTLDEIADHMPLQKLARLMAEAARGVHYAHTQGVVHRDIKPTNFMMDHNGRVYVMDFGLARQSKIDRSLSVSGEAIGTPAYTPPEQAQGRRREIDARSDVYGLGATLYHLSTGRIPFDGNAVADIIMKVVNQDPAPPRKINSRIPPDLETIILKSMEKERGRRYPTAKAFADDIDRWAAGEAIQARPPSTFYRLRVRIRKEKKFAAALAALVLVVLIGLIVVPPLMSGRREAEAARKIEEARRLYESGKTDETMAIALEAQELAPHLAGGRYWQARCTIQKYARRPRFPTPWVSEGAVEFLPGLDETDEERQLRQKALALVEKMGERLEPWEKAGAVGIVSVLDGRYADGEKNLQECVRDERSRWDAEAEYFLALARYYQRKFVAAAGASQSILRTAAGGELLVRALQGAALTDELSGRSTQAFDRYDQARALASMIRESGRSKVLQASILVSRGSLRARLGKGDEAKADLEQARQLAEAALKEGGATRDAHYQRAEAAAALGRYRLRRGKRDEAVPLLKESIADYSKALSSDPSFLAAYMRRGLAREDLVPHVRGDEQTRTRKEAIADFETVARKAPGPNVELALRRLSDFESYEKGVAGYEALARRYPTHLPALLAYAKSWIGRAQEIWEAKHADPTAAFEAGERGCTEAIKANPEYTESYMARGAVYQAWGDYLMIRGKGDPTPKFQLMFADLERALKINPELYEAYRERAGKLLTLGVYKANMGQNPEPDWLAAIEDHGRVTAINPEESGAYTTRATIRMNIAYYYQVTNRDPIPQYELAIRDCDEAQRIEKAPIGPMRERGNILIRKGFAHAARGQTEEARKALEQGVKELQAVLQGDPPLGVFDTVNGETFLARAQALCALGRHAEAQKDYERAAIRGQGPARALLEECRRH